MDRQNEERARKMSLYKFALDIFFYFFTAGHDHSRGF